MTNKKILVTRSSMPPLKEYINEISSLWESHWLTNMGEKAPKNFMKQTINGKLSRNRQYCSFHKMDILLSNAYWKL